jgi:hypothetical protein
VNEASGLGVLARSPVPYGGATFTHPELMRTWQPWVNPGDLGGVPGVNRVGFYPFENAYSPGDSANIRAVKPDAPPYYTDRRVSDTSMYRGVLSTPLLGLAAVAAVLFLLEHHRPKGKAGVSVSL